MGANATTFVPTYVAGEVLTAADMNVTNSGIPVFATTTTRDAAFGGTGEKTLAEGQFAYIEASNETQYYDGAAWQSVGTGATYTSFTPTFTNFTLGNGSLAVVYAQLGKLVHYVGNVTLGSTSSMGTSQQFTLPVNSTMPFPINMGTGVIQDVTPGAYYNPFYFSIATNTIQLALNDAATAFLSTTYVDSARPMIWATGDTFAWNIVYRAA